MFVAWIVAVVTLIGLLYWGDGALDSSVRKAPPVAQSDLAASPSTEPSPPKTSARADRPASHRTSAPAPSPPSSSSTDKPVRMAKVAAPQRPEPEPPPPKTTAPPKPPAGYAAIVIDDFGIDYEAAKKFVSLPVPITFSILPYQRHSRAIARLAHENHKEVLLHLPMEPQSYPRTNPGKGALLLSMSPGRMRSTLREALTSTPYISGVNNHMGSRFTEDEKCMQLVLEELKKRGLYFLDSRTSPRSQGCRTAERLHMPACSRDIFLDHVQTETFVRSQIQKLIRKAKIEGTAVAIGHPHEVTHRVLAEEAHRFRRDNIRVISLGKLIKIQGRN